MEGGDVPGVTYIMTALGQMTAGLALIIPAALAIAISIWMTTKGFGTAKKIANK